MTTALDAIRARWAPVAPSNGSPEGDMYRAMESVTRTMNYHHAPADVATLLAEVARLSALVEDTAARALTVEAERDGLVRARVVEYRHERECDWVTNQAACNCGMDEAWIKAIELDAVQAADALLERGDRAEAERDAALAKFAGLVAGVAQVRDDLRVEVSSGRPTTPTVTVAQRSIEARLRWPSIHWGTDGVHPDAWPHVAAAAAVGVIDHLGNLLATHATPEVDQ